jgi:type IV secretory pathway protease TraF
VVARRGAEAPIVKRAVGLPGESVGIAGGDLVIDGERLPLSAPRPAPIPVFDDASLDVHDFFLMRDEPGERGEPGEPWSRDGGAWRLDAQDVPPGSDAGLMLFRQKLLDDYIGEDGRRVVGRVEVNDARLECECEVAVDSGPGILRFRLVEAGDTFEARIALVDGARAEATLVRFNSKSLQDPEHPGERILVLARESVELVPGAWTAIAFENVDNHLLLDVGGQRITAEYKTNEPHAGPTEAGATSLGPRVALGGESCRARFRRIRVLRDLFYAPLGRHAVTESLVLGPDEIFLLGDNSAESRDSRMFGPVPVGDVIGRPTRVVWPFGRMRRLLDATPR